MAQFIKLKRKKLRPSFRIEGGYGKAREAAEKSKKTEQSQEDK